jgi:glutathionyl-hydroquinone reductase
MESMLKKKEEMHNFLDLVPKKSSKVKCEQREEELIRLIVPRDSLVDRIVRKLFFTPDAFKIDLDDIGSFVWRQIDGQKTIYEIGQQLKEEFKEEAEPLYERLVQFMNILKNNKFIEF